MNKLPCNLCPFVNHYGLCFAYGCPTESTYQSAVEIAQRERVAERRN